MWSSRRRKPVATPATSQAAEMLRSACEARSAWRCEVHKRPYRWDVAWEIDGSRSREIHTRRNETDTPGRFTVKIASEGSVAPPNGGGRNDQVEARLSYPLSLLPRSFSPQAAASPQGAEPDAAGGP